MPRVGGSDLFESSYRKELDRRLDPYGVLIEYSADRAALDGGLHLYKPRDLEERGEAEVSDVRVWFQCKGIQASTLSADDLASRDATVAGLTVDHVQFWFSSPEPVYLIVYLEAVDAFLAADMHDLVDERGGIAFLQQLRKDGQATLTFRVPRSATLERALEAMPQHRSLRIDGPTFRGRPLGHRFDPLRSWLEKMEPQLFVDLVDASSSARLSCETHDRSRTATRQRHRRRQRDRGNALSDIRVDVPRRDGIRGRSGHGLQNRSKAETAHGDVLVVCHSQVDDSPRRTEEIEALITQLQGEGINRALVFFNESEMGAGAGMFGSWRVTLEPLVDTPQGVDGLGFNVLTTTLVYLDFVDRLSWRILNYL